MLMYLIVTIASLLRYSSFHQENWKPRYNWNIFEIGIKLHNPQHSSIPVIIFNYSNYTYKFQIKSKLNHLIILDLSGNGK